MEDFYNKAYNQGIDHSLKMAELIIDKGFPKSSLLTLFLAEFSKRLIELKEVQAEPMTAEEFKDISQQN